MLTIKESDRKCSPPPGKPNGLKTVHSDAVWIKMDCFHRDNNIII